MPEARGAAAKRRPVAGQAQGRDTERRALSAGGGSVEGFVEEGAV